MRRLRIEPRPGSSAPARLSKGAGIDFQPTRYEGGFGPYFDIERVAVSGNTTFCARVTCDKESEKAAALAFLGSFDTLR
ncbi:MAG: hypothetical protein EON59_00265 [Alphaproteobacteria bacterium]|nr:MAG: hypothetical protein EON59_00265 [Alphaproteobacteria bacterium]